MHSRMFGLVQTLALILWILSLALETDACPPGCTCTMLNNKNRVEGETEVTPLAGRKVVCDSTHSPASRVSQLQPPPDTVYWVLDGHSITIIPRNSFAELTSLARLDLSNNQISTIEPGAFTGLNKLQRLDLLNNKLGTVNSSMFEGLPNLKRLSLSGNQLTIIPEGAFDVLTSLERIDFQSEYLSCNCKMQWLVPWQKKNNIRISTSTTCSVPNELKGQAIRRLKRTDLHCEWPLELPLFELQPSTSQIVFQGDKLPFQCKASVLDPTTKVMWMRKGHQVLNNHSAGHLVDTELSKDKTVITKRLVLEDLEAEDAGAWKCQVQTAQGNISKSISIFVMPETVTYCETVETSTDRGVFHWPKTVAGVMQDIPCVNDAALAYSGEDPARAYYRCDNQGNWQELDVSQCRYESEVTQELESVAQFDLNNVTQLAAEVDLILRDARSFTNVVDIIYAAESIEKLSKQLDSSIQLRDVIVHLVSNMMDVDGQLLLEAQKEDKACSRMIEVLERLPEKMLVGKEKITKVTPNIVVHARVVDVANFEGITCASYRTPGKNSYLDSSFACSVGKNITAPHHNDSNKLLEASLHLPSSIFNNIHWVYRENDVKMVQFISYKNAKLFPVDQAEGAESFISTSVISSRIGGAQVLNSTSPIVIQLSSAMEGSNKQAVYWDFLANDGKGAWVDRGCTLKEERGTLHTLHCSHLTNFAVLQDPPVMMSAWESWLSECFTMSPAVYVGTAILVLCTMATILTYITCHSYLKMPGKAKHSIANMCVSILLLCVTYTLGVRTKRPQRACQIIGIAIHYFSLCTLFWIAITSYNMYKKFTKAEKPPAPPPEPVEGPPLPKPMLRFYLVGWGVSSLICGIATAINLNHYNANPKYCFLTVEPAIAPFFIPVALLIFITCTFFCCICCVVRGSKDALTEPETEEVNDLEVINNETTSVAHTNMSSMTAATSMLDLEYRPITQLHAIAVVLLLYVLTWLSGAFAVSQPFTSVIPHQDIIFNYMYGIFSACLGIFILVFYCLGRRDTRRSWKRFFCCENKEAVLYSAGGPQDNIAQVNGHVVNSNNSLESSYTSKSNNTSKMNGAPTQQQQQQYSAKKPANVNLISSHTGTFSDPSLTSAQEVQFYNPRQNGIARKYWQKNRQQKLLNQLNKELKNTDSGHSSQALNDKMLSSDPKCNRHSYGSSGDGSHVNTHLSLEIQIQPRSGVSRSRSPSAEPQNVAYNSLGRPRGVQASPLTLQQPLLNAAVPIERYRLPISRGNGVPPYTQFPPPDGGSQVTSGQTSPEPDLTLNAVLQPPPPLNMAKVAPIPTLAESNTHSLPRQNKTDLPPVNEYMQRNGSVPRLRDFDGQSSVSQEPQGQASQRHKPEQIYRPPYLNNAHEAYGATPGQVNNRPQEIFIDCPQGMDLANLANLKHSPNNKHSPTQGGTSQTFPANSLVDPTSPEIDLTQFSKVSGSKPKRPRSGRRSKDSQGWENEYQSREPEHQPPSYAFVDHDYKDKVVSKLLRQQSENGGEGLTDSNMTWLPRSVSAYDQAAAGQNQPMLSPDGDEDESTSLSSSEECDANEVWVLQKGKKKRKFKKETSV